MLVGDEPYYGPLGFKRIPRGQVSMPRPVDLDRILAVEFAPGFRRPPPAKSAMPTSPRSRSAACRQPERTPKCVAPASVQSHIWLVS